MKHLLNNLSSEEKNSIREQHAGGMKVMTENFSRLINAKSGEIKSLVNEEENDDDVVVNVNDIEQEDMKCFSDVSTNPSLQRGFLFLLYLYYNGTRKNI